MRDGTVTHQFCLFISHLRKMFDFRAVLSNLLTSSPCGAVYPQPARHELCPCYVRLIDMHQLYRNPHGFTFGEATCDHLLLMQSKL